SEMISAIAGETIWAIETLFPKEIGRDEQEVEEELDEAIGGSVWSAIPARKSGYIQALDDKALLKQARELDIVIRMELGIGDFVIKGTPLVSISQSKEADDETINAINESFHISNYRTVMQDADFGIRQIVDIAIKALSPGVNDTTTATTSIDYLGSILCSTVRRRIPSQFRYDEGELRVIARGPTFDSLTNRALNEIRQNADGNVAVILRLLTVLRTIGKLSPNSYRSRRLWRHAVLVSEVADSSVKSAHDRLVINRCLIEAAQDLHQEMSGSILIPVSKQI
ncbi:MAG TPA: DUF2254 family protein, partial [Blastocatellia bacterium]|nr:DUF2254 family protein [Blastocatellia bacterium]